MYLLGVDGGGTKTTAVLLNLTTGAMTTAKAGPGNIAVLGKAAGHRLLEELLEQLLAGVEREAIRAATFSFAGVGREREKSIAAAILRETGLRETAIMTDARMFYFAYLGEDEGILLSSGTGAVCCLQRNGEFLIVGGWGYLLGDEGSGFAMGRDAIRYALQDDEKGLQPAELTKAILRYYDLVRPRELQTLTYASVNPQNIIASCAEQIGIVADAGDKRAAKIVDDAASALVELLQRGIEQFGKQKVITLALAGGVLNKEGPVTRLLIQKLGKMRQKFEILDEGYTPAAAAVCHAAARVGLTLPETTIKSLRSISFYS